MNRLPNFLILGAAKAGTTALYYYLRQHPQIYMTPLKETNFFALKDKPLNFCGPGDDNYVNRMSITCLEQYQQQFDGVRDETAIGEASPLYLYEPKAAACIKEHVPDAKLLVILRNPIDRAYSAFVHLVRDGRETTRDFAEALTLEDERIAAGWEHIWHYKKMGLYAEQLERYFALFGRENVRVDLYYDFKTRPVELMQEIFAYLDVDNTFAPDISQRYNEASVPHEARPPLLPSVRAQLLDYFRDDSLRVQQLIGRDLSRWLQLGSPDAGLKPLAN